MALVCPNLTDPKWIQLVNKVGEIAAYRTFYRNAHLIDPLQETLDKFDISKYNIEQKKIDLEVISEQVVPIRYTDPETGEKIHEYQSTSGKNLESVSRVLDNNEDTKYRGKETVGSDYSDKGTAIHKVFEDYINDISDENILKTMQDQGIPESFLTQVKSIVNHLKTKGKVLSETMLADLEVGVAGTGDIPVLLNDGTVELYDIKTAHKTPRSKKDGKIWDPVGHFGGYKARRYPTQLEMYARMIERTTGQPVSKKYIIPIEISYNDDLPANGYKSIKTLPFEDVDSYGNKKLADKIVSDFFGDNRITLELPSLLTNDDSDDMLRSITGRIEGREVDLDKEADHILSNADLKRTIRGEVYYVNKLTGINVKLKDQHNKAVQKRQIIDEYLSKLNTGRENITESMYNYLITGKDAYLDIVSASSTNIKAILDIYKGRRDVSIAKLSDIKGFENKKSWILITDGDVNKGGTYDLIYVGNDVLDDTINVSRKNKKGDTLFAKHFSDREATHLLSSSLRNTIKDAKKLEAALIAIKLKESSPKASFNRILITSTHSSRQQVEDGSLDKVLSIVQKLGKLKPELIPTNMKSAFNDPKLFDYKNYGQTALDRYKSFIIINANARERRGLNLKTINAYEKEANGMDQLKYKALAEARDIEAAGLNTNPVMVEEMRLLRNIYYNIEAISNELYPISMKSQFLSMGQNIAPEVIQDLVSKTADALRRVTNNFWDNYKKPTEHFFNSIFSPFYTPGGIRDAIVSDTDRYYEPLLEKKEMDVIIGSDEAGNSIVEKRKVNTYSLLDEKSDSFREKSEGQQKFITMFNDRVEEAMAKLGIDWKRGRIPLVHSSYRNQIYKSYQLGANATLDHYKNSLRKMFDDVENAFSETIRGSDEFSVKNRNVFISQDNSDDHDGRLDMMGLLDQKFADIDKNGQWETNLEVILDLVMMTAYRTDEMERLNNVFLAAKNHFDWQKTNLFEERIASNIDMVKTYRTAIIENKDLDSGTIQNKATRTANKVASGVMLGFKPGVALLAGVGAQVTAASEAISNSLAGNGKFGIGDWSKAFFIIGNPLNYKKVNALLEQYKLFDLDMSSLMNGRRRYGDKSIFKMKWMFGFLNAGDWVSRSQILVAQMLQDGNWDAHSMDEKGELQYDEDKDERFKKENGQLLKSVIKASLEKEGLAPNGKMSRAYDFNITKSIKAQIDMVIGGFDKETRGMYNHSSWGKLFGMFKTYMPSRIDKWSAAPFQSRMIGKYELTEQDGKKQYLWKGDQLEGIFHSLNTSMFYLQNLNSEHNVELNENQKQNLSRFAGDFLMIGLATLLGYVIDDDDDETKMDDLTAYALQGAIRDLLAFYNVFAYLEFVSTPVSVAFLQKTTKRIYNIVMNAADHESDTLVDTINLLPAAKEYKEIADFLYDQPSE